jgi:hypothetical protein
MCYAGGASDLPPRVPEAAAVHLTKPRAPRGFVASPSPNDSRQPPAGSAKLLHWLPEGLTPCFTLFAFPLDSKKVNCDKADAFEGKRSVPRMHWVQLPKGGVQCECRSEIHG